MAEKVAGHHLQGFEVGLGEIGTFKRGRLARVVWLAVGSGADALAALAGVVESESVSAGLAGEERPFKAQLTLARSRKRLGAVLPELPALPQLQPWRADELILYSSHLGRAGAIYEPLRAMRLDGG